MHCSLVPVTQVIYAPITLGILSTAVTSPPTTAGVLAIAPVAEAAGFQPNTGNVDSGQIPIIDGNFNAVTVASGQYVDIDVPTTVQMSPTVAPAATATSVPIVGAVDPSTLALTTTYAGAIGGND